MELVVVDNDILENQQDRVVVEEGRVEVEVVEELGIAQVGEGEDIALLDMVVPALNAVPVIRVSSFN